MFDSSNFIFESLLYACVLFFGIVGFIEIGYRIGKRRQLSISHNEEKGIGAVESTVFALLSLLLVFLFTGATSRFDHRRDLIVEEANAIGTAYLRIDLLPEASQAEIRSLFKRYVQSRLTIFQDKRGSEPTSEEYAQSIKLQNVIWDKAVASAKATGNAGIITLVISPINDFIDITNTRLMATRIHPPLIIYSSLFALALIAALLVGYNMSSGSERPWFHILIFAASISFTIFLIIDIEYPRLGFILIDSTDKTLAELLESMK